jgi:hypothetical protein
LYLKLKLIAICKTVPFATLNSTSCSLIFDLTSATSLMSGLYGAALQIEDFYTSLDPNPISSVPLQFLG